MLNKYEKMTAVTLLYSYELAYRDKRRINHCVSAEHLYRCNSIIKYNAINRTKQYKPEVLNIVTWCLRKLAVSEAEAFKIIQYHFKLISNKYRKKNCDRDLKRYLYNSQLWSEKVNLSLDKFWQTMQQHPDFDKYFYRSSNNKTM